MDHFVYQDRLISRRSATPIIRKQDRSRLVVVKCDNLALMRMSSQRDIDELATIFGFAPSALLDQSPLFRQGEALFAGGFVPAPSTVQGRKRFTHEGGRDVSVPLSNPT